MLGFIRFYLDNTVELSKEEGYISLPDAVLNAQRDKISALLPK